MSKINVNIRLDKHLKEQATLLADQMGTNLSTVINIFLVKFTRERKLEIGLNNETKFENFDNEEVKSIEGLTNFNYFMNSIKGK